MNHTSTLEVESTAAEGVRYRIKRISFGRRLELARVLRDKLERLDRVVALPEGPPRETETAVIAVEIGAAELRWGLESIDGLDIDGTAATPESLLEHGPEPLVMEILAAIRHEAGLDEDERKNSAPPSISCAGVEPPRAMRGSAEAVCDSSSPKDATAGDSSSRPSTLDVRASSGAPDPPIVMSV